MNWKTKTSKRFLTIALSTVMLAVTESWLQPDTAEAAANAVPTYEVKFLLKPDVVLSSGSALQSQVANTFQVNEPAERMLVQYFDTPSLTLNDSGWNVRFRKKEDKKKYELTYKKRFPVANGDINGALTQANNAGFSAADSNYEAEVDWGYSKQTLSFSNKKETSASKGLTLPSEQEALELLLENLPGKLDKTNGTGWGTAQLQQSYAHGPITATRYNGTFEGLETSIELWPIKNADGSGIENNVEISFKTDNYQTAASTRADLLNLLQNKDWLIPADGLKTNLVLERY